MLGGTFEAPVEGLTGKPVRIRRGPATVSGEPIQPSHWGVKNPWEGRIGVNDSDPGNSFEAVSQETCLARETARGFRGERKRG